MSKSLFHTLHELAAGGIVMLTVSREGATELRVNVVPKTADKDNPSLAEPLSVIGTPDELDHGIAEQLTGYHEARQGLRSNLDKTKAEMDAAAKKAADEAKARAKARTGGKPAGPAAATATPGTPAATDDDDGGADDDTKDDPAPAAAATAAPAAPDLLTLMQPKPAQPVTA
jgi:PRTRC genetic system protein E